MSRYSNYIHSVFIKLLLVIILIGIVIATSIGLFFQNQMSSNISKINLNLQNYFTYIARQIGSPPDTVLAKNIAQKYSVDITYNSKNFNWTSVKPGHERGGKMGLAKIFKDEGILVQNSDGSSYVFDSNLNTSSKPARLRFMLVFSVIIAVLVLGYVLMGRILKPVKLLSAGVVELSKGNFSNQVPVKGSDELGLLANSFNKMAAKIKEMLLSRDRLLLDVSHELRTPLTRIKLALELIEDSKNKESIAADIKEIESMITSILDSQSFNNSGDILVKVSNDLAELIKEAAENYSDIKPGIIINELQQPLIFKFDYSRMKMVVNNLLDNALKYSRPESNPVEISLSKKADEAVIKITDEGIGIPSDDLPYIFEPFFRADWSRSKTIKGFGLGLSICKKITEAHGGIIKVVNNEKKGVTVFVTLPLTGS